MELVSIKATVRAMKMDQLPSEKPCRKSAEREPKESLHSRTKKVAEGSVGRTEDPERGGNLQGSKTGNPKSEPVSRTELETGLASIC